jgi:MFS family permease
MVKRLAAMGARPDLLLRFLLLYGTLYSSFGLSSPFLPEFLTLRGVESEWLGLLLGAATAVRLVSAPVAGRVADVFGSFRLELALFAISAAVASLLYLPAHSFWLLVVVTLAQAAMLAPLAPLSDALALSRRCSSRISSAMLVRDSCMSSAKGAFGRHERQDNAGMRVVTAASRCRSSVRRSIAFVVRQAGQRTHRNQ